MRLRIWVNSVERDDTKNSWRVNGLTFGDNLGFGDSDNRSYSGKAVLIARFERVVADVEIFTAHVPSRGTIWCLSTQNIPAEDHFLLTDALETGLIAVRRVQVKLNARGREHMFLGHRPILEHPVQNGEWFGVLRLENERRGLLYAFGESGKTLSRIFEISHAESQYRIAELEVVE